MTDSITEEVKKDYIDALRDASVARAMQGTDPQTVMTEGNIAFEWAVWMAECGWTITRDREPSENGKKVIDAFAEAEKHVAECEDCKNGTHAPEQVQPQQREPEYVGAGYL